jgi:hypothetical protein
MELKDRIQASEFIGTDEVVREGDVKDRHDWFR